MSKSFPVAFFALLLLAAMMGLSLHQPTTSQAHPEYGFTPQPPPPPPPPPRGEKKEEEASKDHHELPPERLTAQLDYCIALCRSLENTPAEQSTAATDVAGPPAEVTVPVRLVHQGSGWIAEATLSSGHSTSLAVPYPGRWDVYLVGEPEITWPAGAAAERLNLSDLQANLANGPVFLGVVEANTAEPQLVDCPVCVTPAVTEFFLPVTGTARFSPAWPLVAAGLLLFAAGLVLRLANLRLVPAGQNRDHHDESRR